MRVTWAREAVDDLKAIDHYLQQTDPHAAARAIIAIRAKADLLQQLPEAGPALDNGPRRLSVVRTPYVIVYETAPGHVSVLRVFDSRQDWQRWTDDR